MKNKESSFCKECEEWADECRCAFKPSVPAPCSPLPEGAILQFLEDGKWMDVATRARTRKGMIRVYKAMCRKHPRGAPYGMRIITIHEHRLGRWLEAENIQAELRHE